ncbi:response regulator [Halobacteria archaeon AArc-dxtr1]|nr:response regulator [Halobacteria archaeon AArc-dxtr1]
MTRSSEVEQVLLVEANSGDARLVEEVCHEMGLGEVLHVVSTGSDALDAVTQRGDYADTPRPDLIILDWHLREMAGNEVLAKLKSDPAHKHIPVIVTTGSVSEREICDIYESNANACISKPAGPDELKATIRALEDFWLSAVTLPRSTDRTE